MQAISLPCSIVAKVLSCTVVGDRLRVDCACLLFKFDFIVWQTYAHFFTVGDEIICKLLPSPSYWKNAISILGVDGIGWVKPMKFIEDRPQDMNILHFHIYEVKRIRK
ncbi:hypothetical protein [Undibacterium sp. Ji22W]|uniref:hypothetical protein n=1 Tax=Undibacterium sp. Ji22W TaxID=3413038 RepID=UPI003BF09A94